MKVELGMQYRKHVAKKCTCCRCPVQNGAMLAYFNDPGLARWLNGYWPAGPLGLGASYLLTLFLLKQWMDRREPIKLKTPLIAWNTCLAIFSVTAFVQFAPGTALGDLVKGGFVYSVCSVEPFPTPKLTFWMAMFIVSKFVEFGDTIFLVLRKAPLTFLHVYHHVSVAVYAWFGGVDRSSLGHWFLTMNFAVHSIMYTYFALKGLGVNIPSIIAKVITSLQLFQFVVGLACVLVATVRLWQGEECNSSMACSLFGLVIYLSYLVLFTNFFYHRYVKPNPKGKKEH